MASRLSFVLSGSALFFIMACGGVDSLSKLSSQEQAASRYLMVPKGTSAALMEAIKEIRGAQSWVVAAQQTRARDYTNVGVLALDLSAAEIRELQKRGLVEKAERNGVMRKFITQAKPPSWGIDRIDGSAHGTDKKYVYPEVSGKGVRAYIIDTGIDPKHPEFQGRVTDGFTAIDDGKGSYDCDGHGSHVAGTVGGIFSGVAKKVQLVPVRVLDCEGSGSAEGVVAGMDWVIAQKRANPNTPVVVNMSLGGKGLDTVDAAAARMVEEGNFVSVAAGNETQDACNVSPARTPSVVTVGASDTNDMAAYYSNFGKCLDLYAPGDEIFSAKAGTKDGVILSGTSMAAPHVAGAGALVLSLNPTFSPAQVEERIKALSLKNGLKEVEEANLLLQIEPGEDKPDPGQPPPPFPGLIFRYDGTMKDGEFKSYYPNTGILKGEVQITAELKGVGRGVNFNYHLFKWDDSKSGFVKIASSPRNGKPFQWVGENGTFRWELKAVSGSSDFEFEMRVIESRKALH
jgi:hypothetical protein